MWYNDSPITTEFNCNQYATLAQDLEGRKKILAQVIQILLKITEIKEISVKLHGGYCRKILVSKEKIWENYFLIRVKIEYKIGNKKYKKSPVIYPSDVYPYGRQTLDVVEQASDMRYKEKKSWKKLEDALYERYSFFLNRIKRMINRVCLVFERLNTSKTIPFFLNVTRWICSRVESFESLTFAYRDQALSSLFSRKIFIKSLFSP